jgi:hypothetical protein
MKTGEFGDELRALAIVLDALQSLDDDKRRFVLSTAAQRLGIQFNRVIGAAGASASGGGSASAVGSGGATDASETAKAFLKRKHPTTDVQRVACLAYYLTHNRKTPAFKTRNLTQLNTEAAGDRFANAAFTVKNATNQNHFLSSAGQGRKQITGLGEDVVEALPDQNKLKEVIATGIAGRRKRRAWSRRKKTSK